MAISVNHAAKSITMTDKGATIRTLLAIAADACQATGSRRWKLILGTTLIGSLQVKDDHLKGNKDARPTTRPNASGIRKNAGPTALPTLTRAAINAVESLELPGVTPGENVA